MAYVPAIQCMEDFNTSADAEACFAFMREQEGFISGRVLPPSHVTPTWRVQTFHDPGDSRPPAWLPDGMRFVLLPGRWVAGRF